MLILCIGDSSGLPRPYLNYKDTWPFLLKEEMPMYDFISIFKRSSTTQSLLEYGDSLEYYTPDIVILQLGIVDCAPRYLKDSRILYKLVAIFPGKIQHIFWLFWKFFFKRNRREAYVSLSKFKKNLISYLDRCMNEKVKSVIIIKIATPCQDILIESPLIVDSVKEYNSIYEELKKSYPFVELIDPLCGKDFLCFKDGYHPNAEGNLKICSMVKQVFLHN